LGSGNKSVEGGNICNVCGGATGNVLYKNNAQHEDVSGEVCPICGRNTDLTQGMENMKIN
jgi:ssDNA-binding Zn-finger/Zn-ribbon topoisomerase 1